MVFLLRACRGIAKNPYIINYFLAVWRVFKCSAINLLQILSAKADDSSTSRKEKLRLGKTNLEKTVHISKGIFSG